MMRVVLDLGSYQDRIAPENAINDRRMRLEIWKEEKPIKTIEMPLRYSKLNYKKNILCSFLSFIVDFSQKRTGLHG